MEHLGDLPLSPPRLDESSSTAPPGGQPMELWISVVLRTGVLLAAAIIALGIVLLLLQGSHAGSPASLTALHASGGRPVAVSPVAIVHGVLRLQASSIIQLGLLALILTPITRVAMTAILFALQRDRAFVAITTIVLAILVLGLLGVGA